MSDNYINESNSRRNLLKGLLATAAVVTAAPTLAADKHSHHHHQMSKINKALVDIANQCAQHGDECIDHCIELFKTGDTTVAKCAETVNEMIVMCRALAKMGTYQSEQLVAVAKICIDVCQVCADECGKHTKHEQCKACEKSCLECIDECKKIIA
jgi:Cys-rich four helix bundle protein (predicted Tat secretion target)